LPGWWVALERSLLKMETYKPTLLRIFSAKLVGHRSHWVPTQTLIHEPCVLIGMSVLKICQFANLPICRIC
ncbi:MAG: hypothetical protein QNL56_05330, partial [Burkholderiales bacterium]